MLSLCINLYIIIPLLSPPSLPPSLLPSLPLFLPPALSLFLPPSLPLFLSLSPPPTLSFLTHICTHIHNTQLTIIFSWRDVWECKEWEVLSHMQQPHYTIQQFVHKLTTSRRGWEEVVVEKSIQHSGKAEECHTHAPDVALRGVPSNYCTNGGNYVGDLQRLTRRKTMWLLLNTWTHPTSTWWRVLSHLLEINWRKYMYTYSSSLLFTSQQLLRKNQNRYMKYYTTSTPQYLGLT